MTARHPRGGVCAFFLPLRRGVVATALAALAIWGPGAAASESLPPAQLPLPSSWHNGNACLATSSLTASVWPGSGGAPTTPSLPTPALLRAIPLWPTLGLIALLLWMVHQRAGVERLQRRHAQTLQAERQRLEAEVARCRRDLNELARHLHSVREDESRRLARELHDELGALLTVAKFTTARLKHTVGVGPANADVRQRLDHLDSTLNQGMALKRRLIESLMPSALTHLGLAAALEIQAREFAQRTELKVRTELAPMRLEDGVQLTVYRLVQECLTNIANHAQATQVRIVLRPVAGGRACISVSDNGRGFDPAQVRCSGHGLLGMRYRVEAVGGIWTLCSSPGQGTRIEADLPALAQACCCEADAA